ncbi:hypothetical protein EV383_6266 [Pseudonocardia sediminis]|uniref:Uncharacterized protein n=1 Tax=Pseudonocardia sediminis TaxID=1397368 RepID=A0A4Q7UC85_PSEST|nr:DUF6409 family protein [Pseudonocardia sediminis]RZT75525.1 hypothetical protein EV383_6266 [Pseudonocardia sediminis]
MNAPDQRFTPGQVHMARPWLAGTELPAQRGILLREQLDISAEYVLLWFPGLGDPGARGALCAIARRDLTDDGQALAELPRTWVAKVYAAARRANRAGQWTWTGVGADIEAAHRANRRRSAR